MPEIRNTLFTLGPKQENKLNILKIKKFTTTQ